MTSSIQWVGMARAGADRRIARPQAGRFVDEPDLRRTGDEIAEIDAVSQRFQRRFIGRAFNLCPVGFGQFVPGIGNPALQGAVIG